MSCEVSQFGYPIHTKNRNDNTITIYVTFRFNLFIVSENFLNVKTMSHRHSQPEFPIDIKKYTHFDKDHQSTIPDILAAK